MRSLLICCLALGLGVAASPVRATMLLITDRAALGADDGASWAPLGPAGAHVSTPAFVASAAGLRVGVSTPAGEVFRHDQGSDWTGNFAPGAPLVFDQNESEPLLVTFSQPVFGVGAQIEESLLRGFTATLSVFSPSNALMGSVTASGRSTAANDDSALFLGVLSDTPIGRIRFDAMGPNGAVDGGFAIDGLSLVDAVDPVGVPEPASALLLATGLAALGLRRRRPS